jgi:hypothetical protein
MSPVGKERYPLHNKTPLDGQDYRRSPVSPKMADQGSDMRVGRTPRMAGPQARTRARAPQRAHSEVREQDPQQQPRNVPRHEMDARRVG